MTSISNIWKQLTPICQIWIIFTHLKLWIASARHNFKWVKIPIELAVKGLIDFFLLVLTLQFDVPYSLMLSRLQVEKSYILY